jgi:hypothetical protein
MQSSILGKKYPSPYPPIIYRPPLIGVDSSVVEEASTKRAYIGTSVENPQERKYFCSRGWLWRITPQ